MGLLDLLLGISENSDSDKTFSQGDMVMVKFNGKVGVIIATDGDYHTVKLKDDIENEYYECNYSNELEPWG